MHGPADHLRGSDPKPDSIQVHQEVLRFGVGQGGYQDAKGQQKMDERISIT